MTATMRAVELRGARDVAVIEIPRPRPGPGEIVLRVEAALTCGTDAKVFRRGYHARMLQPPCLFGHEFAGTIEEVGEGVSRFFPGDRVVGANSAPCGRCVFCAEGRESLCEDLLFVNGAFAEWLLLPARVVNRNLHALPDGLDARIAAAIEPVACILKGLEIAGPHEGQSALLLGAGPIALMFAQKLRVRGVRPVLFARSEVAADLALRMGCEAVVVGASILDEAEALREASRDGRGYDLVVEAAGAHETTQTAPALVRRGGKVLLFGGCAMDVRMTLSPARLHYDEISILASFHHTPRHVTAALDALAEGRLNLDPLLETSVGLEGVAGALHAMCERDVRGKVPVLPHAGLGA